MRFFSLHWYHFTASPTTAEDDTELEKERKNPMNEPRVRFQSDSENDELCALRMIAIKDREYSGWRVNGGF